jgi:hypothetical protein
MRGWVWVSGLVLLGVVLPASAREVRPLGHEELARELARNEALAAYVARNGMPDVAESRFLSDQPPWDDHEVALYYLNARKEIAFARAWLLGRPTVSVVRAERRLTSAQVAALEPLAMRHSPAAAPAVGGGAPAAPRGAVGRAEAAARRAEEAAARVEAAAGVAERAALRAEQVVAKIESARTGRRRK